MSANIIEGCGREVDAESREFLGLARQALQEVIAHVSCAHHMGLLDVVAQQTLLAELGEARHLLGEVRCDVSYRPPVYYRTPRPFHSRTAVSPGNSV
jgi:four helix bundle protein